MKLKGGRELDAFLSAYPVKMQRNVMRGALRAGAKVFQKSARQKVEKESGQTAKDIKIETDAKGGIPKARVKLKGEHSHIGRFLEYGVAPHLITAGDSKYTVRTLNKRGKRGSIDKLDNGMIKVTGYEYDKHVHTRDGTELRRMKIGNHFIGGAVLHPGIKPHPFMRPAWDEKQGEASAAVGEYVRKRMQIDISTLPPLEIEDE